MLYRTSHGFAGIGTGSQVICMFDLKTNVQGRIAKRMAHLRESGEGNTKRAPRRGAIALA